MSERSLVTSELMSLVSQCSAEHIAHAQKIFLGFIRKANDDRDFIRKVYDDNVDEEFSAQEFEELSDPWRQAIYSLPKTKKFSRVNLTFCQATVDILKHVLSKYK